MGAMPKNDMLQRDKPYIALRDSTFYDWNLIELQVPKSFTAQGFA